MFSLLPDKRPPLTQTKLHWSCKGLLNKITSPFTDNPPKTRRLMKLAACAFFVAITMRMGIDKVRDLYLMNLPFCLDSTLIGWFMMARNLGAHLFTLFSVATLSRCLHGMGLGILGMCSSFGGYLMYGFAQTRLEVFMVPAISVAQHLPITVMRGETSRLLGPEQQGPLFASLAVIESICFTLGPVIFLPIYKNTQTFQTGTGTPFLCALVFVIVVLVIMIAYQVTWVKHRKELSYRILKVNK